jgi:hypothetical protein
MATNPPRDFGEIGQFWPYVCVLSNLGHRPKFQMPNDEPRRSGESSERAREEAWRVASGEAAGAGDLFIHGFTVFPRKMMIWFCILDTFERTSALQHCEPHMLPR